MAAAIPTPSKGHAKYLSIELTRFLRQIGRTSGVILQTDQEPAIKLIVRTVSQELGIPLRHSPVGSSQSQGSVERFHSTLYGQVRTLKRQLERSYNIQLNGTHPITTWLIRHAAWTISHFQLLSDGHTAYQRRWTKAYHSPLCTFGETVSWRETRKHTMKAQPMWHTGIWLGRDSESDEHMICTDQGVLRTRCIRRNSPSEAHDEQLLQGMIGLPGRQKEKEMDNIHFLYYILDL